MVVAICCRMPEDHRQESERDRETDKSEPESNRSDEIDRRHVLKGAAGLPFTVPGASNLTRDTVNGAATNSDDLAQFSFEAAQTGATAPPDPWRLRGTAGITKITTRNTTNGDNSFRMASFRDDLDPTEAILEVDLTDVDELLVDAYVDAKNAFFGAVKLWIDEPATYGIRMLDGDDAPEDKQYRDVSLDLADYTGTHLVILFVRGNGQDVYWDNLRLVDAEGNILPRSAVLPGSGSKPSVSFDTVPARPQTSEQTIFEASASDSDGTIAAYDWDLDDDGEFEKSGQRVEYSFQIPGQQTVTLEVTDDDGLATTATQTFDVPLRLAPEKRDLAERIDEYSTTELNDAPRADQRVTEMTDAVKRGDLDTAEAEDAVERLLRAEQLSEVVLENIGPSPEDEEGEPELGESYNLSRASAKPILQTALDLLVGVAGARGGGTAVSKSSSSFLSLGGVGKVLKQIGTEAVSGAVTSILDRFFGTFTDGRQSAKQSLTASAGTIAGDLSTNSEVTSSDIVTAVTTEITPIVDTTAVGLRLFLEQDIPVSVGVVDIPTISVDTSLDYLYSQITTDAASDGLLGTVEAARTVSETKISEINGQAQLVSDTIEDITELGENSDLFTALADLFDPGEVRPIDALEVLLGVAETVVGSITDAIKTGVGVKGLIELGVQQALGTFLVVQGRESL